MKSKKFISSALILSGALTFAVPAAWSQGIGGQGEPGGIPERIVPPGPEKDLPKSPRGDETGAREGRGQAVENIREVQQALKEKGHDPGPVDGVLGPKTQQALKSFQEANGLTATGRVDAETMAKLGVEGGEQGVREQGGRQQQQGRGNM